MEKYSPRTKRGAARKSEAPADSPASTPQRNSSGTYTPTASLSLQATFRPRAALHTAARSAEARRRFIPACCCVLLSIGAHSLFFTFLLFLLVGEEEEEKGRRRKQEEKVFLDKKSDEGKEDDEHKKQDGDENEEEYEDEEKEMVQRKNITIAQKEQQKRGVSVTASLSRLNRCCCWCSSCRRCNPQHTRERSSLIHLLIGRISGESVTTKMTYTLKSLLCHSTVNVKKGTALPRLSEISLFFLSPFSSKSERLRFSVNLLGSATTTTCLNHQSATTTCFTTRAPPPPASPPERHHHLLHHQSATTTCLTTIAPQPPLRISSHAIITATFTALTAPPPPPPAVRSKSAAAIKPYMETKSMDDAEKDLQLAPLTVIAVKRKSDTSRGDVEHGASLRL
ncbi:hypothetical protein O3P69_008074 [Scylla paramamosain]|uniref:Uncharacterized protein n=1 Tax=Scylla paramamosain TaxID=85552 RepID=A0AAW0T3N1_SCYPA